MVREAGTYYILMECKDGKSYCICCIKVFAL